MSQNKDKKEVRTKEVQPTVKEDSQTDVTTVSTEALEIINNLPEEQRKVIMSAIAVQHFEGPIPPAPMMRDYEDILPGSCDRIITMSEKEQTERHNIRRAIVSAENLRKLLGLVFGALIVGAVLFATYDLAIKGHDAVAGTLGTVTMIGLATIFVLSKEPSNKKNE